MNETVRNGWVINALLAVILTLLIGVYMHSATPVANAAGGGWETNGIMALNADPGENLIMINTDPNDKVSGQNIMLYKLEGAGKFRLIGARSYKYDLELIDTAATPQTEDKYTKGVTFKDVYEDWQKKGAP